MQLCFAEVTETERTCLNLHYAFPPNNTICCLSHASYFNLTLICAFPLHIWISLCRMVHWHWVINVRCTNFCWPFTVKTCPFIKCHFKSGTIHEMPQTHISHLNQERSCFLPSFLCLFTFHTFSLLFTFVLCIFDWPNLSFEDPPPSLSLWSENVFVS